MNPVLQQFVSVALPIVGAIAIAAWLQNGRFADLREDMNRGFDQITKRLDRIEAKLDDHAHRIATLEERTSPLARR